MNHSPALTALLLSTSMAMAQPLLTSLPTKQDSKPAPQLEDRAAKPNPGVFPLLECLNSLVRGDTAKAEKSCSAALMLNAREHDAYTLRGYAYLIDHRFELAEADFQAALRLRPENHGDRAGYAQSLSGQGRFQEAVAQYRKAVELAPDKAPYWNGLCWARAGNGQQLGQALRECNQALSLQPGAAATLNSRGLVYLRLKKFDRAIADYTASLQAAPLQASARFGRGMARLYSGEAAKGRADIVEARRLDAEIDRLFGLMGVLQSECLQTHIGCPPGFPTSGNHNPAYLVAKSSQ